MQAQAHSVGLEILHGYGAQLRVVEAIKLFSFAHTMGMDRESCHQTQFSGFVGWSKICRELVMFYWN